MKYLNVLIYFVKIIGTIWYLLKNKKTILFILILYTLYGNFEFKYLCN